MSITGSPIAIVTGANKGIGKEVAVDLLHKGYDVTLACRNMEACELVAKELREISHCGSCNCSHIDVGDFKSVRNFAKNFKEEIKNSGRKLDLLVNNAGVMGPPEDVTLRVNHFGPYLLTRLLLPAMGQGSRIVNVSSRAHYFADMHIEDGKLVRQPHHWLWQYAQSKLCNVLFTAELQRRLQPSGIRALSTSPGLVATNLFAEIPGFPSLLTVPFHALMPYFSRTPAQGARSTLHAALSPDIPADALFIHDDKPVAASALAQDKDLAQKLWEMSEKLVGLGPDFKEQSFK